jgi:MYXO-CTERM domain-containing protein
LTPLVVGETAKTAGYGDDGSGTPTNGRYERAGLKIDAVGPSSYTYTAKNGQKFPVDVPVGEIVTGESTCFGDSGGPLFDSKGNVIGVTSRGIDDSCIDRPSIYSDTASHAELIRNAAKTAGHPLSEAPSDTTPSDPSNKTDPNAKDDGTGTDGKDDGTGDDDGTTTPKKKKPSSQLASAGCSAASSPSSSPLSALALGVVGLALLRRRRHARR